MMIRTITAAIAGREHGRWRRDPSPAPVQRRPSHTDNALADGNVVQLTPSTVVTVNGREVPLEALTPGSNIILESMAPTTRNGRHTNSAIPSFRDRYGGPGGPAKRRDHTFRMAVATAAVAPAALPPPHHAGLDVQLARDLRQGFRCRSTIAHRCTSIGERIRLPEWRCKRCGVRRELSRATLDRRQPTSIDENIASSDSRRGRVVDSRRVPSARASEVLEGPVIKRALRALFTEREKPTYFEIQLTDNACFLLRPLTFEARAWSEKVLAEPVANGDRLVSSAIVTAIAAEAIKRGYLVRFV